MKYIAAFVLVFVLLVSSVALADVDDMLGKKLPEFSIETTDGSFVSVSSLLKEKEAVMINIFATWCPPCEAEFPIMSEVYNEYSDKIAILAFSGDQEDTLDMIREYKESHNLPFIAGVEPSMFFTNLISLRAFPTTMMIDRFGTVCFVHEGAFSQPTQFRRLFDAFIGDSYTESVLFTDLPLARTTVAYPDEDALNAAVTTDPALHFTSDPSGYHFPMLPSESDASGLVASNYGIDSSKSAIYAEIDVEDSVLAFDYSISSEDAADTLQVVLDGEILKYFSGNHTEESWAIALPNGSHLLSFVYEKDVSESVHSESVLLKNVRLLQGDEGKAALDALPVYPVAETRSVVPMNEDAKFIDLTYNGASAGLSFLVCSDPVITFKILPDADIDPEFAAVYNGVEDRYIGLSSLLSEDRSCYLYDMSMVDENGESVEENFLAFMGPDDDPNMVMYTILPSMDAVDEIIKAYAEIGYPLEANDISDQLIQP